MITSSSNAKIKNIIALQKRPKERKEQGLFVVEGRKLVGEAPAGWISEVYVSESYATGLLYDESKDTADEVGQNASSGSQQDARLKLQQDGTDREISSIKYEVLSDDLFAKVSDTRTPQGILALVRMPSYEFSDLLGCHGRMITAVSTYTSTSESASACSEEDTILVHEAGKRQEQPLILVLEDIQDPGNLGTILRTAEGAGVTGVVMSRGTADVFNPKVVRSTMGSIYRVPFLIADDLADVIRRLKSEGVKLYAAHLKGSENYDVFGYCEASGFMIGNEANGLSDEIASLADAYVRIPMCGQVESLNAAVSAALLSYEAARQRRHEK